LPLEQINGSTPLYYLHDQLSSTRALTNESGTVVDTYTYDAYGNLVGSTGSDTNPLGFAGAYSDAETGFLYLTNRYYDPSTGQFLTVDPLVNETGQSYAYTGDDPVNAVDPLGLSGATFNDQQIQWCNAHTHSASCAELRVVQANSPGGCIYEANPFNHGFWGEVSNNAGYSLLALPAIAGGGEFVAAVGGVRAVFFSAALASSSLAQPASTIGTSQVEQPSEFDLITAITKAIELELKETSGEPYREPPSP